MQFHGRFLLLLRQPFPASASTAPSLVLRPLLLRDPTPAPTRFILVVTLLVTIAADVRILAGSPLSPRTAAAFLALFTLLFLLRVLGQVLVVSRQPGWLPPMEGENWNLVPYNVLLPAQLAILIFMAFVIVGVGAEVPPFGARRISFGLILIAMSAVYAGIMALRYAVRMTRRPDQRWFGGAIPIVFHMVLASFLLAWGRFHAER